MNRDDRFLKREYLKNLFPVVFSILGGTVNVLIDGVMVSQRLGASGLAAVNTSMPVYLVICIFGALVSGGAFVQSARDAGKLDMEGAARHYRQALTIGVALGLLLTAAGCLLMRPIARGLSQGTELYGHVYAYSLVTVLGALPTILGYFPVSYLQLDGKTRDITVMMVLMIAADVILDYLFLFIIPLGTGGAAAASVAATALACVYGFAALRRGGGNYRLKFGKVTLRSAVQLLYCGSPSAMGNLVDTVKLLLLNSIILSTGGTSAAAVWAALNSLSEFSVALVSGVPQAAAPMTGVYYAAKENSALRILMELQFRTGMLLGALYAAALCLFSGPLSAVFSLEGDVFLPFACLGMFVILDMAAGILTVFLQTTGRVMAANTVIVFRKLLFPVGTAFLLAQAHSFLWAFLPLGAAETLLAYLLLARAVSRKSRGGEHALSAILLLDDYLERENRVLDFSVVPTAEKFCAASEQIRDFCAENQMDSRQTMRLQLAIEELLAILQQKNSGIHSVDLRAFALEETIGLRIRCAGVRYDPFADTSGEEALMGVRMLRKMASSVNYTYAFGTNTINIEFEKKGKKNDPQSRS